MVCGMRGLRAHGLWDVSSGGAVVQAHSIPAVECSGVSERGSQRGRGVNGERWRSSLSIKKSSAAWGFSSFLIHPARVLPHAFPSCTAALQSCSA